MVSPAVGQSTMCRQVGSQRPSHWLMPPKKSGGPLSKEDINFLKLWIEQGAPWPDGLKLTAKEKKAPGTNNPDNLELGCSVDGVIVDPSTVQTK